MCTPCIPAVLLVKGKNTTKPQLPHLCQKITTGPLCRCLNKHQLVLLQLWPHLPGEQQGQGAAASSDLLQSPAHV